MFLFLFDLPNKVLAKYGRRPAMRPTINSPSPRPPIANCPVNEIYLASRGPRRAGARVKVKETPAQLESEPGASCIVHKAQCLASPLWNFAFPRLFPQQNAVSFSQFCA